MITGIGNDLAPEDAAGLALFEALKARLPEAKFQRWVSPRPELALGLEKQRGPLVFIDSLAPEAGDTLLLCLWRPGLLKEETPVSSHGFGLSEVLALAKALRGALPPVYLVGVPPSGAEASEAAAYIKEVCHA